MLISYPEYGIEYQEFIVTVPVNAHKKTGKERLMRTLMECTHFLSDKTPNGVECQFTYQLVFRARQTHILFHVLRRYKCGKIPMS